MVEDVKEMEEFERDATTRPSSELRAYQSRHLIKNSGVVLLPSTRLHLSKLFFTVSGFILSSIIDSKTKRDRNIAR